MGHQIASGWKSVETTLATALRALVARLKAEDGLFCDSAYEVYYRELLNLYAVKSDK